jgi:DNA-cytosine methyltransferase
MDLTKLSKLELLIKCEELGIKRCKSKTKNILISLINQANSASNQPASNQVESVDNTVLEVVKLEGNKKKPLNVIDLFCGCGGMSKGLTDAGLNIIAGIDIWDAAINSYKKNFHHQGICADLKQLPPEKFNTLYNSNKETIDLIVGGPPCFIAGTKILTYSGYKNIEDVKLDDKLLTHTGKFQDIINLQEKIYTGNLYELDIKYHPEIITCTEEHPFYVREKQTVWDNATRRYKSYFNDPKWKKAADLTINDYYGMVINTKEIIPEFTFDKIINQHKKEKITIKLDKIEYWYMMGYFIGDGWIEETKECNMWFEIYKIFEKYKQEKIIPEWVHDAPKEFIQEFINGYMKADSSLTYDLALGLQRLYLKLGYIFVIEKKSNIYEGKIINSTSSFIENNYVWYASANITKRHTMETPVYNFEVAVDNSYIVYNTICHNCQGFSIAGKRDTKDPRNSLFMEYVKYINYFKPKAFIMENVIGILSMKTEKNEKVIDIILAQFNTTYNCIVLKLYASDFEVPQNRRRTIIIGIRKDLQIMPYEPKPILTVENRIPVKNILQPKQNVDAIYYLSEKALNGIKNKKLKAKEKGTGFGAQYLDFDKPSYTIPARYWKDGYDALVKYSDTEIRRLTILELKRIQSFPDDYIIEGSKKDIIMQIGNAVACKFAYHLGKYINNILP